MTLMRYTSPQALLDLLSSLARFTAKKTFSHSQRGDKGSASDRVGGGGSPPLLDASLLHLAHPCHRLRQPTALAPPHLPGRAQPLHRPLPPPLCVQVKTGSEGHRPPFGDNQVEDQPKSNQPISSANL